MKITIVGGGIIGSNLAKSLAEEDHEVYLIERDEEVARKLDEKMDVKVIVGSGSNPEVLTKVVDLHTDLMIAVTTNDETNLVVCSLAAAYGAKRRIARVRNSSLSNIIGEFGYKYFNIDEIINPEQVAAEDIVKTIEAPGSCEVADFANGRINLRAFDIPADSELCNVKIGDLNVDDFPWPFLIISIIRDEEVIIPKGDTVIQEDDRIYTLLPSHSLSEFLVFVNPSIKKPTKVVVYGATITGEQVSESLSKEVREIVLIEDDEKTAEMIAGRLSGVRVIHGSATESDILTESGVEAADAFISCTENDHTNLISAMLAKKMGAKTTAITTRQPDYMAIVDALDIDIVVNPRFLAVDQILRLVRGKGVSHVTNLLDCDAETVEFVVEEGASVTKEQLKDLKFPKNSIVGAMWRGEEVHLAKGNTQIKTGDKVIVFCEKSAIKKLQKMFSRKKTI